MAAFPSILNRVRRWLAGAAYGHEPSADAAAHQPKGQNTDQAPDQPMCSCFDMWENATGWRGLTFHQEEQDTGCDAWKRMLDLVDRCADEGWEDFIPRAHLEWEDWVKIITLPATIAKLTSVRRLQLYGSRIVRIPPEIGKMESLRDFDVYTSYRLHWLPFEITHCRFLWKSCLSTRALYGNYKTRFPFPRLPARAYSQPPAECSVCGEPVGDQGAIQAWISLRVATDVMPLLVHACSQQCIDQLPAPPSAPHGYVEHPHRGGPDLIQPPASW